MLIVNRLDIEGFRGIRRLTQPLRLEKVNVLIGRNNAGKTSILEAMFLLSEPYIRARKVEERWRLNLYRSMYENLTGATYYVSKLHKEKTFSALLYGYTGSAKVSYILHNNIKLDLKIEGNDIIKFSLNGKEAKENDVIEALSFMKGRVPALYIPDSTSFYDKLKVLLKGKDVWNVIEAEGYNVSVIKDLYEDTLPDRFTEVLVRWDRLYLRKEVADRKAPLYVNVDSLGEGVQRTLLIYLTIKLLDPALILWDDAEVALHPALSEKVIEWLSSLKGQVVIATHSIDVLRAFAKVAPPSSQVVYLDRKEYDTVEPRTVPLEELEEVLAKGLDPRFTLEIKL